MGRGARGPYSGWGKGGAGFGAFLRERRIKRGMTQANYARFIKIGLRTLIEAEKDTGDRLPWGGSAMFHALAGSEFADQWEMQREFDAFKAEQKG